MGKATREAYGNALARIGKENTNIIVLDADLSKSTKTDTFKAVCPERFFNVGIAEQNLISVGAGLAAAGKIPFVSSFSMFATGRAFEQIRNAVCYPKLNVKVCATHAGITVGEDGAVFGAILIRLFKASVVRPLERDSSVFPTVMRAGIMAADSK